MLESDFFLASFLLLQRKNLNPLMNSISSNCFVQVFALFASCFLLLVLFFHFLNLEASFYCNPFTRQVSLIILFGYMAYSLCEVLHFSGIMAMFTCGVVMTHYTYHNISDEVRRNHEKKNCWAFFYIYIDICRQNLAVVRLWKRLHI